MGIADKILEKYGDTVRFEWHDFPVITSNSPIAAQAGMCAYDQGFFWEFHDVVYENYPRISVDDLKQYAVDVGLEARVFNQCLDSKKYLENVNEELKNAHRLGLRSTPSFRVNEKVLIGPPSFEQISTIVDEILEVN
jgi:protein-disulfide isomerase